MLTSVTMTSELLTLSGISHVTQHDGYCVQSTPTEPNYWMGNQLIVQREGYDFATLMRLFEQHFPNAEHRSFVWDIPNMAQDVIPAAFVENGYKHDDVDALVLGDTLRQADAPDGVRIRAIQSDADWAAALELQTEIAIEEGYTEAGYREYLDGRNKSRRIQIAKGLGQWFGAFEGEMLVCQMGMFNDARVARYQSVETRKTHRRRGICSALLRHAALWALDRAPDAKVVIVARMDSDAGRLYRSMGFAHAETIHGVIRGVD